MLRLLLKKVVVVVSFFVCVCFWLCFACGLVCVLSLFVWSVVVLFVACVVLCCVCVKRWCCLCLLLLLRHDWWCRYFPCFVSLVDDVCYSCLVYNMLLCRDFGVLCVCLACCTCLSVFCLCMAAVCVGVLSVFLVCFVWHALACACVGSVCVSCVVDVFLLDSVIISCVAFAVCSVCLSAVFCFVFCGLF